MRNHFDRRERYCFAEADRLIESLADERVLDAVIQQLEVPGKPGHLKAMSAREKHTAIETQIRHFCGAPTSIWNGCDVAEIYAATVFRSNLPIKVKSQFFPAAKKESDLLAPVAKWLRGFELNVYDEVPVGTKRIDVLGHRSGTGFFGGGEEFYAVELKNDREQLKRGLDQMTTFADYANEVYLNG